MYFFVLPVEMYIFFCYIIIPDKKKFQIAKTTIYLPIMTILKKFNKKYPGGEKKLRILKSYFHEGFEFPLKAIPENVICW